MRQPFEPAITIEQCLPLSMKDFKKADMLWADPGTRWKIHWILRNRQEAGSAGITVLSRNFGITRIEIAFYTSLGIEKDIVLTREELAIHNSWSPVGGMRLWFICPCMDQTGLDGGVRELFLAPGTNRLKCRRCHSLTYESQRKLKAPRRRVRHAAKVTPLCEPRGVRCGVLPGRLGPEKREAVMKWPGFVWDLYVEHRRTKDRIRELRARRVREAHEFVEAHRRRGRRRMATGAAGA